MTRNGFDVSVIESGAAPQAVPCGSFEVGMQDDPLWITPGALLAQKRLCQLEHVVTIGERLEGARYAVFVVVDDDPEELLDAIFGAEQEIMRELPAIPFDLRIRSTRDGWSPDSLLASCIRHYQRHE
jgi:hypothetical protein